MMAVTSGANPDAIRPDDLIAFIDGEASAVVREKIGSDPTLRAAADAYARTQRHLKRRLYRFACPSPQALGEYDLGLLDPVERTRVAAHVIECPRCAAELRTLRDFMATEDDAPPVGAIERMRRIVATLLPPPPRTSPYASLRGAEEATTRTYQAGDVTITLDLGAPVRRGKTSLVGLLWRNGDDPETIAGSAVVLSDETGTTQTTAIDEVGNFTFDDITPGAYRLEVTLGDDHITIEGLRIGQ
ncbi:MAG: zf-HC2 domain-containing protein [Thermomicrobiales bacterium]